MLPSGPTTTSLGWLNWPSAFPGLPAMPRLSSFSPFGLNLWTWCPFVPALFPEKSAIHTLPPLSTEIPCGVTITPLPKFASTAPPPAPPAAGAPQRSYAQTLPSIGSISMPAVVPQERPAGSWPQFRVTFGAGFGNPWPVIGLDAGVAAAAAAGASRDVPAPHAARSSMAHALTTQRASRDVDICLLED